MTLHTIDLRIADRLEDREFRREWFRAELESVVPEKFRDLREYRRMTQTDLARDAQMKQSAISRFEKSRDANWNLETLLKMADALGAQLTIDIIPAEVVIARYRQLESGTPPPPTSVLSGLGTGDNFNREPLALAASAVVHDKFNPQRASELTQSSPQP